jgi:hypothetical protein
MLPLSTRSQTVVGCALIALLVLTRGDHFPTLQQLLPSASWAVFFLAGVYLRPAWAPALLFGTAGALDYAAVTWGGTSDFCVSPAYIALLPAYGSLWLAGRWYAGRYRGAPPTLLPLAAGAFAGTLLGEVISSGGFYFYSGRFADPTFAEFTVRFEKYFPASLESTLFWVAAAALVHVVAAMSRDRATKPAR